MIRYFWRAASIVSLWGEINDLNSRLLTLDAERELKKLKFDIISENDISVLEKEVSIAKSQLQLTQNLFRKASKAKLPDGKRERPRGTKCIRRK